MHLNRQVLLMFFISWQTSTFAGEIVTDLDGHVNKAVKSDMASIIDESLRRHPQQQVLSRKRRYLEFPEGSSFQLVYDLLVGVVDYTNYIAVSMTLALAWELPSKSPFEILEDVEEKLRDGTYGVTRNDNVTNIEYVDTKPNLIKTKFHQDQPYSNNYAYADKKWSPVFIPPMHKQYSGFSPKSNFYQSKYNDYLFDKHNNDWRRNDPYYYSTKPKPFEKFSQNFQKLGYSPNTANYPWWNLPSRLQNLVGRRQVVTAAKRNFPNNHSKYYQNPQNIRETVRSLQTRHHIFPIFGKRSVRSEKGNRRSGIVTENLQKLDRIHVRQQRSTRHKLYDLIEKYLERKNLNGHSCVLRALCETAKKSQDHKPGSFVGELMRAIFTLPEPLDEEHQIGYKEQRYDSVHDLKADCSIHHHQCEHDLWSSHIVA